MTSLLNALKKKKTPEQLVRLSELALKDDNYAGLSKRLASMKEVLYGEETKPPVDAKCAELSAAIQETDIMPDLIKIMSQLPFETRKDLTQVFNNLIRKNHGNFCEFVARNPPMIFELIEAYENPEIAILCGSMLRECVRYESLARMVLYDDRLWKFFDDYVHLPNFAVASDAFATLKELLTRHKTAVSEFLNEKFDLVFENYNILLESSNYVTRRQSLKLLGELLLDRSNFSVMIRYIESKENLKKMMILLRDTSANIQYEAFHVFKVFVANPNKPPEIERILVNNRAKLTAYLENFHRDKEEEQFAEEKQLLITTLKSLSDATQGEDSKNEDTIDENKAESEIQA
eukprot:CAMPEP_0171456462 /NCGR_PEP_ID=MMETSP0945-20130129/2935_1 /TAXON_ID=109269 /ORGANISM="Vaucheria litorea, Strain CCMP2940" /LENGTH=346 /DNA_ID=CAMNT_0011981883 /DNA_START=89 /DNA_END=1129 /DNA_ORIENTATION=+